AGGLRLTDPGTDLAVAVATYSAVTNRPVDESTALVGEVGLAGELRSVSQLGRRVQEAERAGFGRVVGPRSTERVVGVGALSEARAAAWGGAGAGRGWNAGPTPRAPSRARRPRRRPRSASGPPSRAGSSRCWAAAPATCSASRCSSP